MSDERRRRSLVTFYFGSDATWGEGCETPEAVQAVSARAYRDLNRTLRGIGKVDAERVIDMKKAMGRSVIKFVDGLQALNNSGNDPQEEFNLRHGKWCGEAIEAFGQFAKAQDTDLTLSYGQAQKWLNMSLKYLAVLGHPDVSQAYHLLHVPLDRIVYRQAKKHLHLEPPSEARWAWSNLEKEVYEQFQKDLRQRIEASGEYACVLDWEADVWADRS